MPRISRFLNTAQSCPIHFIDFHPPVFLALCLRGCDDKACDWSAVLHHHRDIKGTGKGEQRKVLLFSFSACLDCVLSSSVLVIV